MHYKALVIGPDVVGELLPYDEQQEVNPHIAECEQRWPVGSDPECVGCRGTGKEPTTRNPDGKWDWWIVGGRWSEQLITLDGLRVDAAPAGEVDWDATIEAHGRSFTLVAEGAWRDRETWDGEGLVTDDQFDVLWDRIVLNLPADIMVTVVDYHA